MTTITADGLRDILEAHRKWLAGDADGRRADLSGEVIHDAKLRGANLSGANLRCAHLYGADLRGANLSDANCFETDLYDANLSGANLIGANLRHANLRDAAMKYANLRGADMSGADLRDADLRGAKLSGAIYQDGGTVRKAMQIGGLRWSVLILDCAPGGRMKIGCDDYTLAEWTRFDDRLIAKMDGKQAVEFWHTNREWLLAAARAYGCIMEPAEAEEA